MLRAEPATRRLAHRTARDTWFDHAVLAFAFALLLSGFRTTIQGSDWWITTVLVATLTGLTCAILRAVGWRWVAPTAVLVELMALAWIFVPSTLFAVVPTLETFRGLGSLARAAQSIIIEEQAPVAAAKPVVLVIASSFGLLVIVADLLLERRRAAPAIGALFVAIFVTPALISGTTPPVWLFLAVAALWLVILRTRTSAGGDLGRRQRGPAVLLGTAALAVAVTFPLVSPDISAVATSWGKPPPAVFGRGINPMLELGQNLRRNSPVTALTYTTSLDDVPYLKVATLRDFTGKTWKPSLAFDPGIYEGAVDVGPDVETDIGLTTITVRQLRSTMLPVPYPAQEVTGIKGTWRWNRLGMTLRSREDDSRGQKYSVTSLVITPTAVQMRSLSTPIVPMLKPYVALPEKMPAIIADTARSVTAEANNEYDKAIALQSYLRSDGDFHYSETAPVASGYDGNGVSVIAEFLDRKSGYCVHFSSAMAVMARTLGIPARIAVGYAPGSITQVVDGHNEYEVTSDDLHAWTELYFRGYGWMQFEPTPGVGSATSFAEPGSSAPVPSSGEVAGADRRPTPDRSQGLDSTVTSASAAPETAPRTAIVTIAALLIIAAAPGLLRALRRRWRLRRGAGSPDPLWRELEDTARDFGVDTSVTDTPRGFAGRLRDRPDIDGDGLQRLLHRIEMARFSRTGEQEGDGIADLRTVVASLHDGATRRERLRARLLPRSLAGRGRFAASIPPGGTATLVT